MITSICLWYIGMVVNAPTWYHVLVGVIFFSKLCGFGMSMYKKGAEKDD